MVRKRKNTKRKRKRSIKEKYKGEIRYHTWQNPFGGYISIEAKSRAEARRRWLKWLKYNLVEGIMDNMTYRFYKRASKYMGAYKKPHKSALIVIHIKDDAWLNKYKP